MSFGEFFNAFSALGDAYSEGQKKSALQALGLQLKNGDFGGAADTAFQAGDTTTGLKILGLGQQQQQSRDATAAFGALGTYMGAGGGDDSSASPALSQGSAPNRSIPLLAGNPDLAKAALAIQGNESGGNYGAIGPKTRTGDRAYGAYQVMGSNVGPWSEEVLGRRLTPQQFLTDREAQDRVFQAKFGQSVAKYGNPQDAASVWFTGRPLAQGAKARDALGTTGQSYVDKFNAGLRRAGGSVPTRQEQAAPVSPVAYADDEVQTQALERQMNMLPPSRQVASADLRPSPTKSTPARC